MKEIGSGYIASRRLKRAMSRSQMASCSVFASFLAFSPQVPGGSFKAEGHFEGGRLNKAHSVSSALPFRLVESVNSADGAMPVRRVKANARAQAAVVSLSSGPVWFSAIRAKLRARKSSCTREYLRVKSGTSAAGTQSMPVE